MHEKLITVRRKVQKTWKNMEKPTQGYGRVSIAGGFQDVTGQHAR